MAKFNHRTLSVKERTKLLNEFWDDLSSMDSKEKLRHLFESLLTSSEKVMLARRLKVVKGLMLGKSYVEIREELGVGLSTIEHVDQWLSSAFEDYRSILPDLFNSSNSTKKNPRDD